MKPAEPVTRMDFILFEIIIIDLEAVPPRFHTKSHIQGLPTIT